MRIGILKVTLYIPFCHSLKEKRSVIRSIKDRVRNRFNVSAAETGSNDKWQKAEMGFSMISNSGNHIQSEMEKLIRFLGSVQPVTLTEKEFEIL